MKQSFEVYLSEKYGYEYSDEFWHFADILIGREIKNDLLVYNEISDELKEFLFNNKIKIEEINDWIFKEFLEWREL